MSFFSRRFRVLKEGCSFFSFMVVFLLSLMYFLILFILVGISGGIRRREERFFRVFNMGLILLWN